MWPFSYFVIIPIGMDIHQLRLELCSGIRLPAPPDCPEVISSLINSCFHDDPYQRKPFKNIKQSLSGIYNFLMESVYLRVDISPDTGEDQYKAQPNIKENYDIMRKLYEEIKFRNEHIQTLGSDFSIHQRCESETAERYSMQYVTLQNMPSNTLAQENTGEVERTTLLACKFGIRRAVKSIDGLSSVSHSFHSPQSSRKGNSL